MRTKMYRRRSRSQFRRRPIRKYGRRFKRRRGFRRYRRTLNIPTQLQNITFKKFKYTENANTFLLITDNTFGTQRQFNINSLWSPNNFSAGVNMPTLQELSSLYLNCKVFACKMSVRFFNLSANQTGLGQIAGTSPMTCYIATIPYGQTLPSPTTLSGWEQMKDYITGNPRYCAHKTLNQTGNDQSIIKLTKYYHIGRLLGNDLQFKATPTWNQPINSAGPTANPTNITGCQVGAILADNSLITSSYKIGITVDMTFYCKFWGMRFETQ